MKETFLLIVVFIWKSVKAALLGVLYAVSWLAIIFAFLCIMYVLSNTTCVEGHFGSDTCVFVDKQGLLK